MNASAKWIVGIFAVVGAGVAGRVLAIAALFPTARVEGDSLPR
jgi:hypothetical protein